MYKLDDLLDILNRAKEAEDLLRELYNVFDNYELNHIIEEKSKTNPLIDKTLSIRLDNFFDFDDSE